MASTTGGESPQDDNKSVDAKDLTTSIPMIDFPERDNILAQVIPIEPEYQYPEGPRFWLMIFALCLGGLLVSLDSTVLGTAVPVISDEFNSLGDIGWYSSVYFMAMSIPQLLFGKLNARYPIRWTYSTAMVCFMVGSAVCGAAPNSPAFIVGRALAGMGSSGLLVATLSLVPFLAPPTKTPILIGLFAATMGVGDACGPLLGGVFTQNVSWRWIFYLNLPFSAFILIIFLLLVHPQKPTTDTPTSWQYSLQDLDLTGLAALAGAIVCLLLALQWGGTVYPWGDGRIIALLVLFGLLTTAFLVNENWQGETAMLPPRVSTQRTVVAASFFSLCSSGASIVMLYYLPIWFQGLKGQSPIESSVDILPIVITYVLTAFLGGVLITMVGHVGLLMVLATVLTAIGGGLLTTFSIDTRTSKWIGYQVIYGVGFGFTRQTPIICVQDILAAEDVPVGFAIIMFTQFFAGAIFIPVAQTLFTNSLVSGLEELGISSVDASAALGKGVTTITQGLSGHARTAALVVVNKSVIHTWQLSLGLSCACILGAVPIVMWSRKPS